MGLVLRFRPSRRRDRCGLVGVRQRGPADAGEPQRPRLAPRRQRSPHGDQGSGIGARLPIGHAPIGDRPGSGGGRRRGPVAGPTRGRRVCAVDRPRPDHQCLRTSASGRRAGYDDHEHDAGSGLGHADQHDGPDHHHDHRATADLGWRRAPQHRPVGLGHAAQPGDARSRGPAVCRSSDRRDDGGQHQPRAALRRGDLLGP